MPPALPSRREFVEYETTVRVRARLNFVCTVIIVRVRARPHKRLMNLIHKRLIQQHVFHALHAFKDYSVLAGSARCSPYGVRYGYGRPDGHTDGRTNSLGFHPTDGRTVWGLGSHWVDMWLQDISLSLAQHLTSLVVEKLCSFRSYGSSSLRTNTFTYL